MVHPVKTPLNVVRTVTHAGLSAARHPIRTAGEVTALGRGLVASVISHDRSAASDSVVRSTAPVAEPAPADPGETVKKQGDKLTHETETETEAPAETPAGATAETPTEPGTPGEQVVTEPSAVVGAGDDEEIPSSAVPYEEDDVEVITPVGTTGAGHAVNPDTTESDLQQPGTEPLMDPSTTKRIKKETDTLRRAADPKKSS